MKGYPILASGSVTDLVARLAQLLVSTLPIFMASLGGDQTGQGELPSRLVQQADLVHQGSFTIPDMRDSTGLNCDWTQGVIAFNPANQSLFLVCHDWQQQVAEISIPSPGAQAIQIQAPRDATEGRLGRVTPSNPPGAIKIGGMHVEGDRLIFTAYVYYDANGAATSSHYVRSTNLSAANVQGPFKVGSMNPAFYAGYFSPIPRPWRSALGGDLLNGQCCLGIVSRTSYGPSVSAVNTADLLAARSPSPATMLVGYPEAHATLAAWDSTGPLFNGTTVMRGVLLPDGTASVLFFGEHGMGAFRYDGGTLAPPYESHVWAYNAHDLAAVRRGNKRPWELKPYATFRLPGLQGAKIGGVTVDPATGRVFVAENFGDGFKPRIHVFAIAGRTSSMAIQTASAKLIAMANRAGSAWDQAKWQPYRTTAPPPPGGTEARHSLWSTQVAVNGGTSSLSHLDGRVSSGEQRSLLWEHSNGSLYVWFMGGSRRVDGSYVTPARVDPAWKVVGCADFDGDRAPEVLWQHTSGALHLWNMRGTVAEAMQDPSPGSVLPGWRVRATADFNGDRKADIVWQEATTGALQVWFMDGATRVGASAVWPARVSPEWRVVGAADVNRDGRMDLIWQNVDGSVYTWFMNGVTATGGQFVAEEPAPGWRIALVADFNDDLRPDLVWQHNNGALRLWYLEGPRLTREVPLAPNRVEPLWRVVGGL